MDAYTRKDLSFAGVKCRVVGTYYLGEVKGKLALHFGGDISNYYPNRGLKVYKPRDAALARIVNFRDPERTLNHPLSHLEVPVGRVRYASTDRSAQGVDSVAVTVAPADLLDQKTALFGMTRTGKSNTAKIIAKSVFELRFEDAQKGRIGQLIFDYNGEYANENVQDKAGGANPSALKNVWRIHTGGNKADVVTYGSVPHPLDPDRRLTKLNFFTDDNLRFGKEILDAGLADANDKYLKNFRDGVSLEAPPADAGRSEITRFNRKVLAYRALLARAGFPAPASLKEAYCKGLFNAELRKALAESKDDENGEHKSAAALLGNERISWAQAAQAMEALHDFIKRGKDTGYDKFNQEYINDPKRSGEPWADQEFRNVIGMFEYRNGPAFVGRFSNQHSPTVSADYADEIYSDLSYIPHFEWRIRSQLRVQFGRIRAWPDVLRR